MDVLSALLREMRLEKAGYRRLELRAPWRLAFDQRGMRGVHIVVEGRCEMSLDGAPTRVLESGDLVIAPRADPHFLSSIGRKAEETVIVCGAFLFREVDHPALIGLPRAIHVPGAGGNAPRWLSAYVDALMTEVLEDGSGSEIVMARLTEALVARALRFHAEQADEAGWLRGLRDPHVAKSLAALHDDLKRPWTLASLAKAADLSRAAFAARFAQTVGETPMRYLLRHRMRRVMTMLRDERVTLARAAESVGYASEAALSEAFKRYVGIAPGAYRRRHRR